MSKKLYEESSVQAIADAIREKNGSTDTYTVAQMAPAIQNISSGGIDLLDFYNWKMPYSKLNRNNYYCMVIRPIKSGYIDFVQMDGYDSGDIDFGDGSTGYFSNKYVSHNYTSTGIFVVSATNPFCVRYRTSDTYTSDYGNVDNYNSNYNNPIIIAQKDQGLGLFSSSRIHNIYVFERYTNQLIQTGIIIPSPIVYIHTGSYYNRQTYSTITYDYYGSAGTLVLVIDKSSFPVATSLSLYGKIIYVPDANLNSYKSATNYAPYSDYIFPLSECPYIDFNS